MEEIGAWLKGRKRMEDLRNYMLEAERLLRDPRYCGSHTDRQLRELSQESKSIARDLWMEHHFDVAGDCFEVSLDGENYFTVSRDGVPNTPRSPSTAKEKRIAKKLVRRAKRYLRQFELTRQGEKSLPSQRLGRQELFPRVVAAV
jgi:hypothetical protein